MFPFQFRSFMCVCVYIDEWHTKRKAIVTETKNKFLSFVVFFFLFDSLNVKMRELPK